MYRTATACLLGSLLANGLIASAAYAQEATSKAIPQRPAIMFNRWQEDWSVLADPRVPRRPLDSLKYVPLPWLGPYSYISFGANFRERFESNSAPQFGTGGKHSQSYLISRTELHADLHLGQHIQAFAQIQSDFAPWKTQPSPPDIDRLDLEQAFVALTESIGGGTMKLRVGRQQFAFDLQRFVSSRDGPNVRQSFDAVWADYETGPWRFIGFLTQPVQTVDERIFDDYSNGRRTFSGLRFERKLSDTMSLSGFYTHYTNEGARFITVGGNERRDSFDLHFAGTADNFDWDVEGMAQTGRVGTEGVSAWAFGSLGGYTFKDVAWSPRIGLQVDAASGDRNPHDNTLNTFNPLFPNGSYLNLAGYSAYVNFIQIKPSITVHPTAATKLMFAVAPEWRETTSDAVYTQLNIPIAGTAGKGGRYSGTYGQIRLDWTLSRSTSFAVEADHFEVADSIRNAGGHNGNYIGVQISHGW